MQSKDLHRFNVGMNKDDSPADLQPGEYTDALNMRIASSDEQQGFGIMETLQGEVELIINVSAAYYGGAIGGQFIYSGYEEVTIGNQVWMKRNLDIAYPGSRVYNNDEAQRAIYGGLYHHEHLHDPFLIPAGWRVPTEADVDELLTFLGGAMLAGGLLKEFDTPHWQSPNTGAEDLYGFQMLPGGMFDLVFSLLGFKGSFWMLDEAAPEPPVALDPTVIGETFFLGWWDPSVGADGYYLTVSTDPLFGSTMPGFDGLDVGNVTHYNVTGLTDGVTYYYYVEAYNDIGASAPSNIITVITGNEAVIIGSQIWMTKNVTVALPDSFVYDDDEGNRILYGGMYPASLFDAVEAAHPGWIVPSLADWQALIDFVGDSTDAGGILKAIAGGWDPPNTGAIDTYAFEARSTGYYISGIYALLGQYGFYWTRTPGTAGTTYYMLFSYDNDDLTASLTADETCIAIRLIAQYTALDAPVALPATNITETSFTANWEGVTGATGYRLTVATDAAFTDIVAGFNSLDVGNVLTYDVPGLDIGHEYFYRLTAYNPVYTSAYSNVIEVNLPISWTVTSRGDGSGVAVMSMRVTEPLTLTFIDGTARFYSDAAGTLNESTTKVVNATGTLQPIYIKAPSGSSTMQFSSALSLYGFGHALGLGSTNPAWGRSTGLSYDANTPGLDASNWYFPNCIDIGVAYAPIITLFSDLSDLSPNLVRATLVSGSAITGDVSDIGSSCELFDIGSNANITGDVADIPDSMLYFELGSGNTLHGDIADLPPNILDFRVYGSNTITGDIGNAPVSAEYLNIHGNNTLYGDISGVGINVTGLDIGGLNTLDGDLADLSVGIARVCVKGHNTIYGDIADIPSTVTYFYIGGDNTIEGNITDLKTGLGTFIIAGLNTITGDIADIKATITYFFVAGYNAIAGNIANLKTSMRTFSVSGFNTITGDIQNFPTGLTSVYLAGWNTLYGNIESLPAATISSFSIYGYNIIGGTVNATLYANNVIRILGVGGYNTIAGDLSFIPVSITQFSLSGYNVVDGYTAGRSFPAAMNYLNVAPIGPGGLSSTEVDNLLIDLSTKVWPAGNKSISLLGTNAARTAASNIAVATLMSLGVIVQTNP